MNQARLLAAFRAAWGADYIDFTFDRHEDAEDVERFAAALESVVEAAVDAEAVEAGAAIYARWSQGLGPDDEVPPHSAGPVAGSMANARLFLPAVYAAWRAAETPLLDEAVELLRTVPDDADTTDAIIEWERRRVAVIQRCNHWQHTEDRERAFSDLQLRLTIGAAERRARDAPEANADEHPGFTSMEALAILNDTPLPEGSQWQRGAGEVETSERHAYAQGNAQEKAAMFLELLRERDAALDQWHEALEGRLAAEAALHGPEDKMPPDRSRGGGKTYPALRDGSAFTGDYSGEVETPCATCHGERTILSAHWGKAPVSRIPCPDCGVETPEAAVEAIAQAIDYRADRPRPVDVGPVPGTEDAK